MGFLYCLIIALVYAKDFLDERALECRIIVEMVDMLLVALIRLSMSGPARELEFHCSPHTLSPHYIFISL